MAKRTPTGEGPQHRPIGRHVAPRSTGSPYREDPKRVNPRPRDSGPSPYEKESGPAYSENPKRTTPKSTSGDKERPVFMERQRQRAPISAKRPKHQSVRRALT